MAICDKQIHVMIFGYFFCRGFEHPPWFDGALKHHEGFFMLFSKLVYLHFDTFLLVFT